jgi:hypothetical protein
MLHVHALNILNLVNIPSKNSPFWQLFEILGQMGRFQFPCRHILAITGTVPFESRETWHVHLDIDYEAARIFEPALGPAG